MELLKPVNVGINDKENSLGCLWGGKKQGLCKFEPQELMSAAGIKAVRCTLLATLGFP
jgi:hypothetical protein